MNLPTLCQKKPKRRHISINEQTTNGQQAKRKADTSQIY